MAGIGILRTIEGGRLGFWCPGCDGLHVVNVEGVHPDGEVWGWNRSYESPTFTPSVLVRGGHHLFGTRWAPGKVFGKDACWCTYNAEHPNEPAPFKCDVCHSFVTDGRIQFLSDCTHALAGQTIQLQKPHHWEDDVRLLQQEGEENSTGGAAADTTVPPVVEPRAGEPEPVKAPPPNPAERLQEQAQEAVEAEARRHAEALKESGAEIARAAEAAAARKLEQPVVNAVHEAATAMMDGQEVVAAMRRSLIEFESALALGTHEIAHEARAFLAHCAEKLKRHIPS